MTTMLAKEETFNSRWLEKECKVKIIANRDKPSSLIVFADGKRYKRTLNVSWTLAKMLYYQAVLAASSVIFQNRCVIADGEVWLISKDSKDVITVSCKTAQHYCEGKKIYIYDNKSSKTIKSAVIAAIEEDVPF